MKHRLTILIVVCILFNKVYAQRPAGAIDSLIKYGIITSKERPLMEKELRYLKDEGNASYRIAILGGLENMTIQKTFHIDPHRTGVFFSYGTEQININSQDSINTSLRALLAKIKRAGLLTDRVYNYTLKSVDSGRYFAELQMIGSLAEMSSRLEWLAPSKLLPVAEELHKNGIVSDSSFLRLKDDINDGKIESAFQLNNYCKYDRIFDMAKYPDDPKVWLEQIHRDIASMLPSLDFTDFNYTEVPDTSFSIPGVRYKVSLICNGRKYKHISLPITNYKNRKAKITPKDVLFEDFYHIFNKILTDQQSPFRLHDVTFTHTVPHDYLRRFSLIALKGEQADVFMKEPTMTYMFVSMDNYDNTQTSAKIDSTIVLWRDMGIFAHLTNAEVSKAIDDAQTDDLFSTDNLLSNFPDVIYNFHDALTGSRHPYRNLLIHLAKITHGAFNPSKIVQIKVGHGLKLQYLSKGKIHSYTFSTINGWFDVKFPAFIKNLSRENELPGNFYQLHYDSVIYLTKRQYNDAVKNKSLSFAPIK